MVGLALAYATVARLVLSVSMLSGNLTMLWMPGGMALAALLAWGMHFWPAVFVGALAAGIVANDALPLSAAIALGNTLETLSAALILKKLPQFDPELTKNSDFIRIIWVGVLCSIVSATIGPLSLLSYGYLAHDMLASAMFRWWQADVVGILLGTPFFLVWRHWPTDWFGGQRLITVGIFFLLVFAAGQIIFLDWLHDSIGAFAHGYWGFLFAICAARRFGRHGVLMVVAIMMLQAIRGAVQGIGYFGMEVNASSLQNLWLYTVVLTATGLSLAISLEQLKQAQKTLCAQQANLTAFFDNSPIGIQVFDVQGRVQTINQAARKMFGVAETDDQEHYRLFDDPAVLTETKVALREGIVATEERLLDVPHGQSSDTLKPYNKLCIALTFSPCFTAHHQLAGFIASIVDRSEAKAHEHQVHLLNQAYAALAQTNREARHAQNESELFEAVCRVAVEVGGMKMAWVGIVPTDSDRIMPIACFGSHTDYLRNIKLSIDPSLPEGRGPTGTAFREGHPVVLQDFFGATSTLIWQPIAQQTGQWQASAAFPVFKDQRPYAVLTLYHAEKNAFDDLIINLLLAMSADISFSLYVFDKEAEHQRMVQALRDSEKRFRAIFNQAAVGLAQIETATGRFIWANPCYEQMIGLTPDQMQSVTFMNITHPADLQKGLNYMEQLKRGEIRSFSMEKRYIRSDQSLVWVNLSVTPMWRPGETPNYHIAVVQDIGERKRNEEKLRLTARIFEATLEGILITDAQRNIIEVNDAFCQITGYSHQEVLGKNPRFLQSGHQSQEFYLAMWQTIESQDHWSGEVWNRRKDGAFYPEWLSISAIRDEQGTITHYVGISSDISLLKQREKQLEHIAHYDALTGIPNRVLLTDRLQQAIAHTRRDKSMLAICYLDLDGFKPINDNWGHETGDGVLIKIAERVAHNLRGGDTLARLGGDEFVILLLSIDSAEDCQISLNRLLHAISKPIAIKDASCSVTASIGVTLYPLDDNDPDTLLRHADQAMYLAKQMGKNRYHIFDPLQDTQIKINHELRRQIKQGLLAGEFELFYQPKVAMSDGQLVGAEALIRWRHPQRGLLAPMDFLFAIENSLLEIQVGDWVIATALAQLEQWRIQGLRLEVSVNVAAQHLQNPQFIDNLQQQLSLYPALELRQLQIEILETAALADISRVSQIIEACSELGVGFALDDFGTGYSSLAYLRKLPADALKIDQSFIRDMLSDSADHAIVQGIIALAQTFKRTTVAEGVETWEHFHVLRSMGCDFGQGYGIARPMPASEMMHWVSEWRMENMQTGEQEG